MKNVSSLKTSNSDSPKTPGGISKSLLTPCRRIGLSRNWRRSGPSPFISPLSSTSNDTQVEKKETRKRKERCSEETNLNAADTIDSDANEDVTNIVTTPTSNVDVGCSKAKTPKFLSSENINTISLENAIDSKTKPSNISTTPSRNVAMSRRKKSKTLLTAIGNSQEDLPLPSKSDTDDADCKKSDINQSAIDISVHKIAPQIEHTNEIQCEKDTSTTSQSLNKNIPVVSKPTKSKSTSKKSLFLTNNREITPKKDIESNESTQIIKQNEEIVYTIKDKSPNDLKKECVVVIQRKLFKNMNNNDSNEPLSIIDEVTKSSDVDDDEPLINLQKDNTLKSSPDVNDDFTDNKINRIKQVKAKSQKSPKSKQKGAKTKENNVEKLIPSTLSINNDDDDDFDDKKTILIRKSYEKVTKPVKAKSTGSITQRDIDNIRNRIEAKKKLLLAQSLTPDTEELRNLIKKWQKGCQDALMELLDLMKNKFPDKERMDYSEMLKTLKIPPSLVGYDSENDCFHSPDDANIILGQFNNL